MKLENSRRQRQSSSARTRFLNVFALVAGTFLLLLAGLAIAVEPVATADLKRDFPAAQIFTFLFLMLGPFKIVGPFFTLTKNADAGYTHRLALLSTLFACSALLVATFLGEKILSSYGIPVSVLALSAGIILFVVALLNIVQQFQPSRDSGDSPATGKTQVMQLAMSPLAFPTIVTPHGIATVVVFLALVRDVDAKLVVGGIVLVIMAINFVVMVLTRRLMTVLGVVLPILGAVLGVIQVALGLQIIHSSLRAMGIL